LTFLERERPASSSAFSKVFMPENCFSSALYAASRVWFSPARFSASTTSYSSSVICCGGAAGGDVKRDG
jgi:hypothetical protein